MPHHAELGYWLAEAYGAGGSRPKPSVRWSGTVSIPDRWNVLASARVLEKAGFTFEGCLRRNVIKDGQVLDSLVYARLRGE